jgi:hypothetical protein
MHFQAYYTLIETISIPAKIIPNNTAYNKGNP